MATATRSALTMTRDDVAINAWAKAAARMKRLEVDALGIFAEYLNACEQAAGEGFVCDLELSPGLAAFYSTFKQEQARKQGREIARVDAETDWPAR